MTLGYERKRVRLCVWVYLYVEGRRGRGPLPKYNKMAGLDVKSSVKDLF